MKALTIASLSWSIWEKLFKSRIFHIKENQWDKRLFYLNKEVCPDFFGSDRISTRASSIAPTDMFPSLFCFISFNNNSLIPISQTYVNGMTNDHWEIGGQVTLCTICLESSWAQLVPWISVPQSGQRKEGIAAFFDRWKNLLETHLELFCL